MKKIVLCLILLFVVGNNLFGKNCYIDNDYDIAPSFYVSTDSHCWLFLPPQLKLKKCLICGATSLNSPNYWVITFKEKGICYKCFEKLMKWVVEEYMKKTGKR